MFRRLNRLSAPGWYEEAPFRILALAPGLRPGSESLTVLFWPRDRLRSLPMVAVVQG